MFLQHPTEQQWAEVEKTWAFERLYAALDATAGFDALGTSMEAFMVRLGLNDWHRHLRARIDFMRRSYVYLRYNFDLGIPDEEWYRSPGDNGSSVQYFPNFSEEHHWHKTQFDYYGDVFYHQWFSSIDTIGQVLNLAFNLGIERPSFASALVKLPFADTSLAATLATEVTGTEAFKKATRLRHDITHNFLPGRVGGSVRSGKSAAGVSISYGIGSYVPSQEIMDNILACLELLSYMIELVAERFNSGPGLAAVLPGSLPSGGTGK